MEDFLGFQHTCHHEQLTSAALALLGDPRCSHLLHKSPTAQFISHIHLHSNLRPSLKQQPVNQHEICSDRDLIFTGGPRSQI